MTSTEMITRSDHPAIGPPLADSAKLAEALAFAKTVPESKYRETYPYPEVSYPVPSGTPVIVTGDQDNGLGNFYSSTVGVFAYAGAGEGSASVRVILPSSDPAVDGPALLWWVQEVRLIIPATGPNLLIPAKRGLIL